MRLSPRRRRRRASCESSYTIVSTVPTDSDGLVGRHRRSDNHNDSVSVSRRLPRQSSSRLVVTTILVVLSVLLSFSHAGIDNLCCLCTECYPSVRGNFFVSDTGDTCDSTYLEMAPLNPNSQKCASKINQYRQTCCDPNYNPIPIAQAPDEPKQPNIPQGPHPHCDICRGGEFPGLPKTVTAVLYIPGNPTCEQLYFMGITGNIQRNLCWPMRDYFEAPCGCGPYHPQWQDQQQEQDRSDNNNNQDRTDPADYIPPQRKVPPRDTKKKLYKGRIRGSTRRHLSKIRGVSLSSSSLSTSTAESTKDRPPRQQSPHQLPTKQSSTSSLSQQQ